MQSSDEDRSQTRVVGLWAGDQPGGLPAEDSTAGPAPNRQPRRGVHRCGRLYQSRPRVTDKTRGAECSEVQCSDSEVSPSDDQCRQQFPDHQGGPDPEPGLRVDWQRFNGGWPCNGLGRDSGQQMPAAAIRRRPGLRVDGHADPRRRKEQTLDGGRRALPTVEGRRGGRRRRAFLPVKKFRDNCTHYVGWVEGTRDGLGSEGTGDGVIGYALSNGATFTVRAVPGAEIWALRKV